MSRNHATRLGPAGMVAVLLAGVAAGGCSRSPAAAPGCASWKEGQTCGGFRLVYSGFGHASVAPGGVYNLAPAPATMEQQTHASLAVHSLPAGNVDVSADVRTVAQLRSPRPNPWEVAWLLWRYVDDRHFYSVALKPNGWEVAKEDPAYPGDQRYLATGNTPTFPAGKTYRVRIRQSGASIRIDLPGATVRITDDENPYTSGDFGLYTEDASIQVTHVQPAG